MNAPAALRAWMLRRTPRTFARLFEPAPHELGLLGEELVARTLRARGARILARRLRTPWGELDLLARDARGLVCVEVKSGRWNAGPRPAGSTPLAPPEGDRPGVRAEGPARERLEDLARRIGRRERAPARAEVWEVVLCGAARRIRVAPRAPAWVQCAEGLSGRPPRRDRAYTTSGPADDQRVPRLRQVPSARVDVPVPPPGPTLMLRVLRHYLPLRKALLIGSETVLLTAVLSAWMTAHLWQPSEAVLAQLYERIPAMKVEDALLRCLYSSFLLSVLAQIAISFNELYDVRVSGSRVDRSGRFVESAGSALALALLAVVLLHTWELGQILDFPPLSISQRIQLLVFAMLSGFALLYGWRGVFHWALRRSNSGERVLILGGGKRARDLEREILERPDVGYQLVGLLPEPPHERTGAAQTRLRDGNTLIPARPRAVGPALAAQEVQVAPQRFQLERAGPPAPPQPSATLTELVERERVDIVVVALEDRRRSLPVEDLLACRLAGVSVMEQEAVYERIAGKIAVEALRPSYLIFNEGFARQPLAELSKRAVDLLGSLVLLFLTWPLMLITAIAVRLDSSGPILFEQERVGREGRLFTLLKFRSMRADAEKSTGPVWATADDPRITRVGRFIRKTRLDELPQLVNVLAGHMSLVGPRPERQHFVEDLAQKIPYFRQRHIVKPGLTGWAQINYRYGSSLEDAIEKLQYDLYYIKNQSLLFDLSILFNTLKIVILRKGT